MDRAWAPVSLDEVEAHIKWLQDAAELVREGRMEAVRYEDDGFNISFRITPAGIRWLETEPEAAS